MIKRTLIALLPAIALIGGCADTQNVDSNAEIKLATWNIAWLSSHEYNQRAEADYAELARYAVQLDADVIALQEVEGQEWAHKVLGDQYDYYFSTKDWVQRVGVAVRKSAGLQIDAIEYKALDVGRVRYGMDVTISRGGNEVRLLAVHLKSGCFDKSLEQQAIAAMPNTDEKQQRRKIACEVLSKQVEPLKNWIDARKTEQTPFIVLGDFNRRFSQDIANEFTPEQGLWQALNNQNADNEPSLSSNESGDKSANKSQLWSPTLTQDSKCWGGYYKDYIDHIVFDSNAKANYVKGSFEQLVFEGEYSRELSNALSDHCPISVDIRL
ncbi:hypothetical protein G3R49_12810 [Shewanella sp. WXL01]|uniref:Endonuclease/exonuclease/phosphatase domain-containing protein n=1 Tax=Shewanella maritima TaxID=2520507 RepID=A0A411PM76_9GAMM|nr:MULTISPECIES: endonuclease/exonuclease/phosphatase family protein [Shewanella]NKF51438.1 hypothetical protein [Shewanella sp. WXL01]QBF84632.1 hypothetical protein EXU30_19605 [Shewanella maritima]